MKNRLLLREYVILFRLSQRVLDGCHNCTALVTIKSYLCQEIALLLSKPGPCPKTHAGKDLYFTEGADLCLWTQIIVAMSFLKWPTNFPSSTNRNPDMGRLFGSRFRVVSRHPCILWLSWETFLLTVPPGALPGTGERHPAQCQAQGHKLTL